MPRYAIFYAPADNDPLFIAAAQWLGRDVSSGEEIERSSLVNGMDETAFDGSMTNARRYGFHGTLKAPFELAEGKSLQELEQAITLFCKARSPFILPRFEVGQLGPFFALLPGAMSPGLSTLAADIVRQFDEFRAPLTEADIARRNPDKLTDTQRLNLTRWGYPYIFESFRFHMTLSDPIPADRSPVYGEALQRHFSHHLTDAKPLEDLCIFEEPERGAPFLLHRRFPLG